MLNWKEYRIIRRDQFGENRYVSKSNYKRYMEHYMKNEFEASPCKTEPASLVCTKGCAPAPTPCNPWTTQYYDEPQQKGNNPMNTNTMTAMNITIPKSDDMQMRDYLIREFSEEFDSYRDHTDTKLRKMFYITTPTKPSTFQGLVDAIKGGKYTVDQKAMTTARVRYDEYIVDGDIPSDQTFEEFMSDHYGLYYGVTFTDFPKPDNKGFKAAMKQWEDAKRDAKTKLMIMPPTEGLDLLLSLRNWTPAGKAN